MRKVTIEPGRNAFGATDKGKKNVVVLALVVGVNKKDCGVRDVKALSTLPSNAVQCAVVASALSHEPETTNDESKFTLASVIDAYAYIDSGAVGSKVTDEEATRVPSTSDELTVRTKLYVLSSSSTPEGTTMELKFVLMPSNTKEQSSR
jgi:hypothetical protein